MRRPSAIYDNANTDEIHILSHTIVGSILKKANFVVVMVPHFKPTLCKIKERQLCCSKNKRLKNNYFRGSTIICGFISRNEKTKLKYILPGKTQKQI